MVKSPKFIIDSNILIESKHVDYGFDICPGFWNLLKKGFEEGLIIGHDKVYRELRKQKDDLWDWVSVLPRMCFPKESEEEFAIYKQLCD